MKVKELIKSLKGLPSNSIVVCVDKSAAISGQIKMYTDIECGIMESNNGDRRCAIVFDIEQPLTKAGLRQDKYN